MFHETLTHFSLCFKKRRHILLILFHETWTHIIRYGSQNLNVHDSLCFATSVSRSTVTLAHSRINTTPTYKHYFRQQKCSLVSLILSEPNAVDILPKFLGLVYLLALILAHCSCCHPYLSIAGNCHITSVAQKEKIQRMHDALRFLHHPHIPAIHLGHF